MAYHTGAFVGLAFNGKLKPLDHYRRQSRGNRSHSSALAFFHSLKAKGVPVDIRRSPRN